jgi:hypothetical protein
MKHSQPWYCSTGVIAVFTAVLVAVNGEDPVPCYDDGLVSCTTAPVECSSFGMCTRIGQTQGWTCFGGIGDDPMHISVTPQQSSVEFASGYASRTFAGQWPCAWYEDCGCEYDGPGIDMESLEFAEYRCSNGTTPLPNEILAPGNGV